MRKLRSGMLALIGLAFGVAETMAQDYYVNLENAPVQKYTQEVFYERNTKSHITDYNPGLGYRLDQPNPVRIPLPYGMSAGITVTCAESEDFSDGVETVVNEGDMEALIYNLVPQRVYYYKMEDELANELARGTITTRGRIRMIYVPTMYNVRDLGGWQTDDGHTIKYEKLYRGSELDGSNVASDADIAELKRLGIEAEADFRKLEESNHPDENGPSPFGFTVADDAYLNTTKNGCYSNHLINTVYKECYKKDIEFIVRNLKAGRPVYMHCVFGADRTGLICLLIEGVLGISYDHMAKDYELTSMSDESGNRVKTQYFDAIINYISRLQGTTLRDKFEYYFVDRLKVSREDIEYLRQELLEGGDEEGQGGGIVTTVNKLPATASANVRSYDLAGRPTSSRGIRIKNGKKYVGK